MKKSWKSIALALACLTSTPVLADTAVTVSVATPYIGVGLTTGSYFPLLYPFGLGMYGSFFTPNLPIYKPVESPDASHNATLHDLGEAKRLAWEEQRFYRNQPLADTPSLNSPNIEISGAQ